MIGCDALNLPLDDVMPHPSLTLLCDDVAKVIMNRPNVFQAIGEMLMMMCVTCYFCNSKLRNLESML